MASQLGVAMIYTVPIMLFCLFGSLISSVSGKWISPPSTLPSDIDWIVIGAYNGTIFILCIHHVLFEMHALICVHLHCVKGERYSSKSTQEYQIATDTFTTTQTLP
eukprot:524221_1